MNPRHFRPSSRQSKFFHRDVKRFGRDTAIFNQGFLKGDDNGREKGFDKGFERALTLVFGDKVQWSSAERRLGNRITRRLFGKKR